MNSHYLDLNHNQVENLSAADRENYLRYLKNVAKKQEIITAIKKDMLKKAQAADLAEISANKLNA
ncbi:MAG: hypothetical protein WCJ29_04520 [bacterium]